MVMTREEDAARLLTVSDTHDILFFFTNRGKVFSLKCHERPADSSRVAKGTAVVNLFPVTEGERVTAMVAVIIGGAFILIFSVIPSHLFLLAVVCVFLFAVMNAMANGIFFASLQSIVPAELQGRVFTILMSLSGSMTPVGLSFAGPVSDLLGIRIWFVIGGMVFIMMGAGSFLSPTIMNIEEEKNENSPTDSLTK